MIDISCCNCCNGCSFALQPSKYRRYSFSKKLLAAIAVVVIIAMFITPTEARTLDRRRQKQDSMAQTKEPTRPNIRHSLEHKRRHQKRLENLTLPTKDMKRPKHARAQIYARETKKVFRKLKNTRSFFNFEKVPDWREPMPSWLPTVNFVEIHFHDYNSNRSRKNGSSIHERKFKYLMPRLYKSLVEYEELFKLFQKMELNFPDEPTDSYKSKRKRQLHNTLVKLYSTIQEVNDSMTAVNMTIPTFRSKDFSTLETKVDFSQCLRNDFLAFRGYGNLLNNWFSEFRCSKKTKQTTKLQACVEWEEKLREKMKSKNRDRESGIRNRLHTTT